MKTLTYKTILLILWISVSLDINQVYSQERIDLKLHIAKADLIYEKPALRSEEGMPVGNGKMGSLVWITPSSLKLQINRVDIFGNNSASNSFFERNTDYCGGAGFVDIEFVAWGEDVFSVPGFRQHLSCYDGVVTTAGNGIKTTTIAWHEKDVIAIRIEDLREIPQPIVLNLRMLRDTVVKRGGHTATSRLKIAGDRIILTQKFEEGDYYCSSAVVAGISGRAAKVRKNNDSELQIVTKPGNEPFTMFLSSAATFNRDAGIDTLAIGNLDDAISTGFDEILSSNRKWWSSFWERSYIQLHSADGEADFVEKNYNYFMYVMASSSLGSFPPKFNGMIWTTGGDARKWGNNYWGANQSCLYNGLFPANRPEIMEPLFRMYTAMIPSLEEAAVRQWGSKGIYIPETVSFDGLAELPDNIADEMRDLYLVRKPWEEKSTEFDDYASTKSPFQSRWNWKQDKGWVDGKWTFTDKGTGTFGHVTHIFSRGAKIAYQYWQRYEFTKDAEWLRSTGYPLIRGVAEFYRNFPNIRKEADGKYHIYHINDNESVRGGHNTAEEISSMMGIFPAAIRASEILNVDAEMRILWKELLQNLSRLPLNTDYPESYKPGAPVIFARSLPPVVQGPGSGRPDGNTMPMWFFDLCNPSAGNTEMLRIANATFDSYFRDGINSNTPVYVLSKLAVTGTMMGRTEATRYLIANQIRTAEIETLSNRMTLREGYQTTGVQNLGRMADALHYALISSSPPGPAKDPVIHLFPAWPADWDADFRLLCRGNFIVSSSFRDGKVVYLQIFSRSGSECRVVNPWTEGKVILIRNGKRSERLNGKMLKFKTTIGENIVLNPA
ncbi:MAG: glycoside hydrolase [Bacteroidales bacterium]|nr:glycoside hydrolase [Bacteroidales bacterium]